MDVKIRVCLPRKYSRFMLFIDNNLLLPGARLHILNNIYRKKVSTENDNNFGNEKITIVVDNIPLNYSFPCSCSKNLSSFRSIIKQQWTIEEMSII
jgi:hypothetical protein